jgi:hypothetical protein
MEVSSMSKPYLPSSIFRSRRRLPPIYAEPVIEVATKFPLSAVRVRPLEPDND